MEANGRPITKFFKRSTRKLDIQFLKLSSGMLEPSSFSIYVTFTSSTPDFPVTVDQTGVAMIAGYSPSILKVLMDKGDIGKDMQIEKAPEKPQIDPVTVMRKAIDDERYNKLQV